MAKMKNRTYTPEFEQQMPVLVRLECKHEELAEEFGCTSSSICQWVKRTDWDAGRGVDGLTRTEREEL